MIIERRWIKGWCEYKGLFLFGIIPLYIKIIRERL